MASRIEDYALIGDCETAALVGRDGSIDWLCWPTFSSPACFAALLGDVSNGRWLVAPEAKAKCTRRYRKRSLILETTFETEDGVLTLIDFMPIRGRNSDIVRLVRGVRGRVSMNMELVLRFDYGRSVPWVTRIEDNVLRAISGPDMVTLRTPAELEGENLKTVSNFTVAEGEAVPFVLTYGESYRRLPHAIDHERALRDTESFWAEWTARSNCEGRYSEIINRSLITLKALTYRPPAASSPRPLLRFLNTLVVCATGITAIAGCAMRLLPLLALMHGGFYAEAQAWRDWLVRAAAGSPDQLQIMYGIRGERSLSEREI